MHVDRAELEQRIREMSDDELLAHLGEDLTELGREVALADARQRGIYLEALKVGDQEAAPIEVAHGHGPLQVCARDLSLLNAQVLAACLQNAGLAARIMDVDTIFASGSFFASLRVMVPQSQLEDAMRIRAAFDAGELAIDEDFDVGN